MTRVIHGKVHGRTIEFEHDLGVAEGQEVEVTVKTVQARTEPWGAGLKRCAGALANDPDWDAVMEEVHRARQLERRQPAEDE